MKRSLIIILLLALHLNLLAAKYEYKFRNTPVSKALSLLVKEHPDIKLTFIYNELESYTTSATISTDDVKNAIKSIIARNPITMIEKKDRIFVEAIQKGKYVYTGKLLNEYKEPVVNATVLLLNPKDSVVVTYGITGKEGTFRIPCDIQPVIGKISSTGYNSLIVNFTGSTMGSILMKTHVIDLDNVDVVANDVQLMADRTVYVPLQHQKNTSMTGIELIEQMGIPQVRIINGAVETNTGQPVSLYIDYLHASSSDLTSMNMQDVKRVEFLESPSDPRFQGDRYVVNFIMEKYVYGGYAKLMGGTNLNINLTDYRANARFQYKRMTYDIFGSGVNDVSYHNGSIIRENYRFPQADNSLKTIERISETNSSKSIRNDYLASFRATYSSDNVTARTIVSGGINDKPVIRQKGSVTYLPEDFNNSEYESENSENQKFVRIIGSCFVILPHNASLTFNPSCTFSHNDNKSFYNEFGFDPVINRATDNNSNVDAYLNFTKSLNKFGSLSVFATGKYNNYRTRYHGSAELFDKSSNYRYTSGLNYSLNVGGIYANAEFSWIWDRNFFNSYKSITNTPSVDLSLSYRFSSAHRINGGFNYTNWAPDVSFKSEGVIESNQLMSYTGNPATFPCHHYGFNLNYTWIPTSNSSLSLFGNTWTVKDRYVYEYVPDGDKMIRYIRQPMGSYQLVNYGISGYLSLFNRRLSLNGRLRGYFAHNGDPYGFNLNSCSLYLSATYWLKNIYFMAYYSGPMKYSDGFMVGDIYNDTADYYFMVGWAGKQWNVRFVAFNFDRWNWKNHTQGFTSEYYDRSTTVFNYGRHARFAISATYTINYGKKQRDVEELSTGNASSSGILRK